MIVVGGEALVDLVPVDGGSALAPRLGGGPFTVAVALGRLGAPVAALTRLSDDAFGQAQLARLADSRVGTTLVTRTRQPTALAVAAMRPDGSASYTFYTAGTATVGIGDPGPLPTGTQAVALGSLALVFEPGASAYETVLRREAAAGRLVVLDPNVRPDVVVDPGAQRARFRSWLPSVGLLKMSGEDAAWLAPRDDAVTAARSWLGLGPRAVVLTDGAAGLTVVTAGGTVTVPAAAATVVDTIGAGDTVQAAVLARLHRLGALSADAIGALDADGWRDVLTYAARAAAVTCSRPGADPPWAGEL